MKKIFQVLFVSTVIILLANACQTKKDYETVKNDPLKARIYTLDNGLKVYMTVNKDEPRIQTYIAVKVGSKNDPAETTGLAHYLEHLMFKGTTHFGTSNYEAEKPLLDQIEQLFEVYRKTTDEAERKALYHQIDSLSYEASKIGIPNEYDKLMAAIGASGTNAYTSYDVTCYVENIPSNQVDNWAKIQSDRFKNSVIRGFHTELETVYEEYNMNLTNDSRKTFDMLLSSLYPNHPYGQQTTIGRGEHLKNPSITNIKNYFNTYYVPNNIAICLSGDFDPDTMINTIKKYFGDMKPNPNIAKLEIKEEAPITKPIEKEVLGLEAENVTLAWRLGKANSADNDLASLASSILYNGSAGLIDLNLIQKQQILNAYAYPQMLADHGMFLMSATPKDGQTLEEAKELLLKELDKLRSGNFDESLLKATIENYKLSYEQMYDNNYGRANAFVNSFINDIAWKDNVTELDRLSKITKEDIVNFVAENLKNNNYVVVYKRVGDPNIQKIEKPSITPILTNRNMVSDFVKEVQESKVAPIEPVFVDFDKDMEKVTAKAEIPVLYKKNETTDLFNLNFVFETGANNDASLRDAFNYISYLGTSSKTQEQLSQEFYNIACSYSFEVQGERSYISLSGLSENMPKAIELLENLLADAQADDEILSNMKADIIKKRMDRKLSHNANFNALRRYVIYGPESVAKTTLTNQAVADLKAENLIAQVKDLMTKQHTIIYYGPMTSKEVVKVINEKHNTPNELSPITNKLHFAPVNTPESKVFLAEYDAQQFYYVQYSNKGTKFDVSNDANIALFNEYFGGSMNSIVFQEMREARALAYSANAYLAEPYQLEDSYYFMAFIGSQNDKMAAAIDGFAEIIENMPESETAFKIAKESLLSRMRTERTIKEQVLWAYMDAQDMGIQYDRNKAIFEKVQKLTLADVKSFQESWIKGNIYVYCILGKSQDLDMNKIEKLGKVEKLSQEMIFGY